MLKRMMVRVIKSLIRWTNACRVKCAKERKETNEEKVGDADQNDHGGEIPSKYHAKKNGVANDVLNLEPSNMATSV